MKRIQIAAFLLALLFMAGIMLFGGLLFMPMHGARKTNLDDVSIEEEAKPDVKEEKTKELAVEKQAPPEAPPELKEHDDAPQLGLDALSDALSPGAGEGGDSFFSRGAAMRAARAGMEAGAIASAADQVFSMSDLDQAPRVVFQPAPEYPAALRKQKLDGTVHVLFVVDKGGRVEGPIVQKSTHPAFEQPALLAVKRWRFEPGKRNGEAVPFRMRIPITFKSR